MVKAWRSESSKTKWRKRKKQNSRFYQLAKWKLTPNCNCHSGNYQLGNRQVSSLNIVLQEAKTIYHFSDGMWTIFIVPGSRTRADFPPAFGFSRVGWNLPANARFFMNKTYFLSFWSRHDSVVLIKTRFAGTWEPWQYRFDDECIHFIQYIHYIHFIMRKLIIRQLRRSINTALNTISSISVSPKLLPVNI